jgi:hypothetical protein
MVRNWVPASRDPEEFERQFQAAVEAGRAAVESEPRAMTARFHASGRIQVELRGGLMFAFPASRYPELASLPPARLAKVRVTASGYGLHWEEEDVHLAVPQVVADLFGGYSARHTGREGGRSRSPAKREAARKNALRGGRPSTQTRTRARKQGLHVEATAGSLHRSLDVFVGADYVIEPLNPAARRNRGRVGRVIAIHDKEAGRVKFHFHDSGRVGLVDAHDLLPLEQRSSAA